MNRKDKLRLPYIYNSEGERIFLVICDLTSEEQETLRNILDGEYGERLNGHFSISALNNSMIMRDSNIFALYRGKKENKDKLIKDFVSLLNRLF